ncbi:hypothetical protein D3C80_1698570 [compost metagenome]
MIQILVVACLDVSQVARGTNVLRVFRLHNFSNLLRGQPVRVLAKNLANYVGETELVLHHQS